MSELCVIGLGYVGLPTAALFARAGLSVDGVDINPRIVSAIERAECPIEEPGLPELVASVVAAGRLRATDKPGPADAFLIAVSTPLGGEHKPDLGYVRSAAASVATVLKRGDLVVLESTVPPGTTGALVRDWIEGASGLVAGRDFALAHCAERAIPGTALQEMVKNDRIVGGIDAASAKKAAALYARMVKGRIMETDLVTSEIVKLAENTYRDVNIALANELARLCETQGADVWKVIELANLHPRVHLHKPGPGVGGHCIPIVPWFLAAASPGDTPLIQTARAVNDGQPERVVRAVVEALADAPRPARVAVLGLAYKAGIDDPRETPALPIVEELLAAGLEVRPSDPLVTRFPHSVIPLSEALAGADAIVVLSEEREYASLDPGAVAQAMRGRVVLDTRNVLSVPSWRKAGFRVHRLGVGAEP